MTLRQANATIILILAALGLVGACLLAGCTRSGAMQPSVDDAAPQLGDLAQPQVDAGTADLLRVGDAGPFDPDLARPPDLTPTPCGNAGEPCCAGSCNATSGTPLTCLQNSAGDACIPATGCGGYLYPCCDTAGNSTGGPDGYCRAGYHCATTCKP